jgi:hypothetical protein
MEAEHTHTLGLMAAIIYATRRIGVVSDEERGLHVQSSIQDAWALLNEIICDEDDDAPAAGVA